MEEVLVSILSIKMKYLIGPYKELCFFLKFYSYPLFTDVLIDHCSLLHLKGIYV